METQNLSMMEMGKIIGGDIPNWLECAGAIAATGIFFGGVLATTGPLGLYVANATLGPTLTGLAWYACAT